MKKLCSIVLSLAMLAAIAVPFGAAAEGEAAETSFLQNACTSITASIAERYSAASASAMVDGDKTDTEYKSALTRPATEPADLVVDIQLDAVYRVDTVKVFERFLGAVPCYTTVDVYLSNVLTGDMQWGEKIATAAASAKGAAADGQSVETAVDLTNAESSARTGTAIRFVLHGNTEADFTPAGESLYQIRELEAFGERVGEMPSNICLHQKVETDPKAAYTKLPESNITDGTDNHYSSGAIQTECVVTINLDGVYSIDWADVTFRLPAVANDAYCDYVKIEAGIKGTEETIAWTTANADGQTEINQSGAAGSLVTTRVPFTAQMEADVLKFTFSRKDYSEQKPYEIAEIMAYGAYVGESYTDNILHASHTETDIDAINATLSEARLTDGDIKDLRYASATQVTDPLTVTFTLDGRYDVTKFRIYKRFDEINTGTTGDGVEILCGTVGTNGIMQWTKAVGNSKLNDRIGANGAVEATEFVLNAAVSAEVIRMIFTKPENAHQYQFPEIEAMGTKQEGVTTRRLTAVSYEQNGDTTAICPENGSFTARASYEGIADAVSVFMLYADDGSLIDVAVNTGNGAAFQIAEDKTVKKVRVLTFDSMQNLRPLLLGWHANYYRA